MVFPYITFMDDELSKKVFNMIDWSMLLMFLFTSPIQILVGRRFVVGAYKGLKHKSLGMDFLVALGSSVAYIYSSAILIAMVFSNSIHQHVFFEASALLLTFIVCGKYLESLAKTKTKDALTALTDLQPPTALVSVNGNGNGQTPKNGEEGSYLLEVPIELVEVDDVIQVLPGTSVSCDGEVIKGQSCVDESMLTGESLPVLKKTGDSIFGGTVNQEAVMLARVTRIGNDSVLSQIVKMVMSAQAGKAPIQEFADKLASVFVPIVVTLSILTFAIWGSLALVGVIPDDWSDNNGEFLFALKFGVATLVVACPCALGLATPTAIMVGTGVGAKNGILIKNAAAIEEASNVGFFKKLTKILLNIAFLWRKWVDFAK
eukprot:TRINITY_DN3008_c0_g1_i4.p1 TRINITY_DN3008_c0_g1~~TRINITY_DN3008_c0_g1_i4.p1  ORF type:complete len:374 (-),score=122.99 TRINITY_DN3008_c0_g1_i4:1-1122(-)